MIHNIQVQMRKGLLEYCILSIISREEVYASDILDILKQANLLVVEGTLYPLLTRMKNEGYLTYRWQESTGGPPRKYYALTPEGQTLLGQLDTEWVAIQHSIQQVTNQSTQ
jgi:PadR family transcriptional regulator PadR